MDESESVGGHQALIRQILDYLIQHPNAKDTIEGISQWWLPKEEGASQRKDVEAALDWLVAKGWLTERAPAQTLFGLNRERVAEIQRFLQEPNERQGTRRTDS